MSAGPEPVQAGPWRITALSDGVMRLDGGAMWGVVPKPLWERMTPPAADNTIPLALRPFLAVRGKDVVVEHPGRVSPRVMRAQRWIWPLVRLARVKRVS